MRVPSFPSSALPGDELNQGPGNQGTEDPSPHGALAGWWAPELHPAPSGLGAGGEAPCSKIQCIDGKSEV